MCLLFRLLCQAVQRVFVSQSLLLCCTLKIRLIRAYSQAKDKFRYISREYTLPMLNIFHVDFESAKSGIQWDVDVLELVVQTDRKLLLLLTQVVRARIFIVIVDKSLASHTVI